MSLVVPPDGGLKGAGPDEVPTRSHGFGGGLVPENHNHDRMKEFF